VQVVLQDDGGTENGGVDASAAQTFEIEVTSNAAPDLAPIDDREATAGEILDIPLVATDPEGDALTFSTDATSPDFAEVVEFGGNMVLRVDTTGVAPGEYVITVNVTDDGQPPKADSQSFTLTVISEGEIQTDLSIAAVGGRTSANVEQSVAYTIVVTNNGAEAVNDAAVDVDFGGQLTGIEWASETTGGAVATASGSDTLVDTVDLPAGATVTYNVTGNLTAASAANQASQAFVDVRASVAAPAGVVDTDLTDNSAFDSDLVVFVAGGDGTGLFAGGQTQPEVESLDAALADFDGDGDQDAFVVGAGLRVLINQGGEQAGTAGEFAGNGQDLSAESGEAVAAGDLDNDGDQDAFVVGAAESKVWFNQGPTTPGQFTASTQDLADSGGFAVGLGDFDGDGDLDAAVLGDSNGEIWINQGGRQNGTTGEFVVGAQNISDAAGLDGALGDLDNDGDLDAFLVGASGGAVAFNQGGTQGGVAGEFTESAQDLSTIAGIDVAIGDFDDDGDLDAFVVGDGGAQVWTNDGLGSFTVDEQDLVLAVGQRVALGDLDDDGDLDALIVDIGGASVWKNDGAGAFTAFGGSFGPAANAAPLADLDGDGDLDAYVATGAADQTFLNEPLDTSAVDAIFAG
jgi:hypothetical protein